MTLEHFSDYVIKSVDNLEPQNDNGGSNNTMIFIIIGVVAVLVIAGVVIKVAKK